MADLESALSELGAVLAGTDSKLSTSLAEILGVAIQELVEAELSVLIGAEHGECTPTRTAQRNGHRPKLLSTPAGDVEVGIPKLRQGSFFPELLEPRRRIDKALWAVIMTAYITGTSTRKVDDLVKALGCDSGVSKSSVSRICKGIDDDVGVLRERRLDHQRFVYVWLDATYVHVRENHQVVSKAVVLGPTPGFAFHHVLWWTRRKGGQNSAVDRGSVFSRWRQPLGPPARQQRVVPGHRRHFDNKCSLRGGEEGVSLLQSRLSDGDVVASRCSVPFPHASPRVDVWERHHRVVAQGEARAVGDLPDMPVGRTSASAPPPSAHPQPKILHDELEQTVENMDHGQPQS